MYYDRAPADGSFALARIIKEEIKREIMNELLAQQKYPLPEAYQPPPAEPAVVFYMDEDAVPGWMPAAVTERGAGRGSRGKGIIYGLGAMALLGMMLPSYGRKIQTILSKAAGDGAELLDKARSIVARAREDVEDLIAEAGLEKLLNKPPQ